MRLSRRCGSRQTSPPASSPNYGEGSLKSSLTERDKEMSVETTNITGREPRLSLSHTKRGQRRLSLRGLATALNALPPEAVSLPVIAEALRSDAFYVRYSAAKML